MTDKNFPVTAPPRPWRIAGPSHRPNVRTVPGGKRYRGDGRTGRWGALLAGGATWDGVAWRGLAGQRHTVDGSRAGSRS